MLLIMLLLWNKNDFFRYFERLIAFFIETFMYYYVLLCLMESVTIKIERSLSDRINKSMRVKGYSTKTEFIREAIRDKLEMDEKNMLIKEFITLRGKASVKTNDTQNKKVREEAAKELARELGINL